jgi:four helix bundle protein
MPYEPLEDKRVYRRAEALADRIWEIVIKWRWFAQRTFGAQWVEASDSVGANVAEAGGRYHPADVRKFLYNARGSLRESKYWMRRGRSRRLVTDQEFSEIDSEIEQLSREINQAISYQTTRALQDRSPSSSTKRKPK